MGLNFNKSGLKVQGENEIKIYSSLEHHFNFRKLPVFFNSELISLWFPPFSPSPGNYFPVQ